MPTHPDPQIAQRIASLTDKQREVLTLVVERKTSKQIARILNISKPAVDQRIANARDALGVATRDEAALLFMQANETYDRIAYDPAYLPETPIPANSDQREQPAYASLAIAGQTASSAYGQDHGMRMLILEKLSGENRIPLRLMVILFGAVGIMGLLLIGLSVSEVLTRLVASS
ncbi:MAG: sigma factor-like helix-turn-helix DNA-binding protein [Sphingorhabdus sp.]